ncbi:hypothetical protein [Actinomadura sp. 6N118]|uniref:hypothetical protein n=1 Tax=Actinomadura sp. 6N118 TaxID=3375151 RepID=UPI0037988BC4
MIDDHLARIDELLTTPFPTEEGWHGQRFSGPRHHVLVLRASQDFWDDRSEEIVEAAEELIDTDLRAVAGELTQRWGEPEVVDLMTYLEVPAPEPVAKLSMLTSTMMRWRPPGERWLALAVGQEDSEFPIELIAAVGTA